MSNDTPDGRKSRLRKTKARLREELRRSEERYRELFDESPAAIWVEDWSPIKQMLDDLAWGGVKDWHGYFNSHRDQLKMAYDLVKILDISQATVELYRKESKEQILRMSVAAAVIDEELDAFRKIVLAFLAGQMTVDIESKDTAGDGSEIIVRRRVAMPPKHRDDWSRVIYAIEDITKRARAEEEIRKLNEHLEHRVAERTAELRESEERLKEAERVALMGHWQFYVGTGGLIRSDQDVRNYGLEPGQMAPTFEAFLQAVHPDDRDMVKARAEKALSTPEPNHYEFRSLWPDGQVRTILTKYQTVLDDDGNLVGMLGVNQDITERKRLESELLRRERLATLGQLTATVGHELRNPLGAIRTSMYIVEKVADTKDDRFTRSVERINRSVTRCDNIIDELLDFTRVHGLELAETGLDRWLGRLLDELEAPEGVEVKRKFDAPDTVVMADVDRFRRAVINVFDNGCQAMIGEGREDTGSEESSLTVRTQERDGRIEVILEDNGPGIPLDVVPNIFEPMFSTKGFGVGLGLPVVKQIMEQHGGGIEIKTSEIHGTKVCLWLPTS